MFLYVCVYISACVCVKLVKKTFVCVCVTEKEYACALVCVKSGFKSYITTYFEKILLEDLIVFEKICYISATYILMI